MSTRRSLLAVGDRVKIVGGHDLQGATATIINSPGTVFNGWTVRLDRNGLHRGIDAKNLERT